MHSIEGIVFKNFYIIIYKYVHFGSVTTFGKCYLVILYIIGYDNVSWRPHDPPSENLGVATLQPKD